MFFWRPVMICFLNSALVSPFFLFLPYSLPSISLTKFFLFYLNPSLSFLIAVFSNQFHEIDFKFRIAYQDFT